MQTNNIHQAAMRLFSRLFAQAGEAQNPRTQTGYTAAPKADPEKRLGFLQDQVSVPHDFDQLGQEQIEQLFGSDP